MFLRTAANKLSSLEATRSTWLHTAPLGLTRFNTSASSGRTSPYVLPSSSLVHSTVYPESVWFAYFTHSSLTLDSDHIMDLKLFIFYCFESMSASAPSDGAVGRSLSTDG